MKDFKIFNF